MPKKQPRQTSKSQNLGPPADGRLERADIGRLPPSFELDDIDFQIINHLQNDGRMAVRELANLTGVTEPNVRSRMRRLEESETIHVTAMVNLNKLKPYCLAPVGIQVRGREVEVVARDLASITEVVTVTLVTGTCDIELQVLTRTLEELDRLITEAIPSVPGVARVDTSLALDIAKYETPWVPFT